MSKKEAFVIQIKEALDQEHKGLKVEDVLDGDALEFWNGLLIGCKNNTSKFTNNGKMILKFMQENIDNFHNLFKAKNIGEGLQLSSRTISGSIRKLVNDGYVEKIGESPVIYCLTYEGIRTKIDKE